MALSLPILGIDARLIGAQRTGDAMVALNLFREVLRHTGTFQYRLYTHQSGDEALAHLRDLLGCSNRSDVEIVSLPEGKNRFMWNAWVLPRELRRRPVAIYHTQYIAPLWLPVEVKLVTHIHDVSFAAYPEWIAWTDRLFLGLLLPRSLERSAIIIAPSEFTRDEIQHYYPKQSGRVRVILNAAGREWLQPISPEARTVVRQRFALPERYILASGTMQPRKNIPLLVEVWRERPLALRDIGLVLTGNPSGHHVDPSIQSLQRAAENPIFTGYVSTHDLRALMAEAEVLAFPSLYEGFGIPILEAFASETPVWASRIAPFEEVAGEAMAAFDPTSLDEAKKTLYNLVVDNQLRERLVLAGRERLASFSWEKSAEKLIALYRTLIDSTP